MVEGKQNGFSLIEIMVVIVIIGLMLGVVAPQVMDSMVDGEDSKIIQDFASMKVALKSYKLANYDYPTTEQGILALVGKTELEPIPRRYPSEGYLDGEPEDPWGNRYQYQYVDGRFNILSFGRDGVSGGDGRDADRYLRKE